MDEITPIHHALAALVNNAESGCWILGGSAGLLLRGLPLAEAPNDIDIYCDSEDVPRLHEALEKFALDVPGYSETKLYKSWLSHYVIAGAKVELVGGFQVVSEGCHYHANVKGLLIPYCGFAFESVEETLRMIPIVPLAHELWFNRLRNRKDRMSLISEAIAAEPGKHLAALNAIEGDAANLFTSAIADELRLRLDASSSEEEPTWTRK